MSWAVESVDPSFNTKTRLASSNSLFITDLRQPSTFSSSSRIGMRTSIVSLTLVAPFNPTTRILITFTTVIISAIAQSQNSIIYLSKSGLPKEITKR